MSKRIILIVFALCTASVVVGQVGINNTTPDASAELDVKSTARGFLAPRMTGAQMTAISNPAAGLAVFNTDSSSYCIYTGTAWLKVQLSTGNHWTASGTSIYSNNGGNVGIGATAPASRLHLDGGNLLVTGTIDQGNSYENEVNSNSAYRGAPTLFFNPRKGALRSGMVSAGSTWWDDANVGYQSFAAGYGVRASGDYAFAGGKNSTASANGSFAYGEGVSASGMNSVALGYYASSNNRKGSFAFADMINAPNGSNDAPDNNFKVTVANSFNVRATGGVFIYSDQALNESNAMYFKAGSLGVGTASPTLGKIHVSGTTSNNVSIYADGPVMASSHNTISDMRVKRVLGRSNSAQDLQTLMQLKITDYRYIDSSLDRALPTKKVIAQEVEAVYPAAVVGMTNVVPDIYRAATIRAGMVALANSLKPGDRVRLVFGSRAAMTTVVAANKESFRVNLPDEGTVFVYGREVNDFRAVDYEALSTLHISATQELVRQQDALQKEQSALRAMLEKLLLEVEVLKKEKAAVAAR